MIESKREKGSTRIRIIFEIDFDDDDMKARLAEHNAELDREDRTKWSDLKRIMADAGELEAALEGIGEVDEGDVVQAIFDAATGY